MKPNYVIFVETAAGEIVRAFTWSHDRASGLARARVEARDRGISVKRVWAEST